MTVGLPVTIHAAPGGAHLLEVDGTDIAQAVTAAVISYHGGRTPTLTLELALTQGLTVDEDSAAVELGEQTRTLLTRLGWTPPRFTPAHSDPTIHTRGR